MEYIIVSGIGEENINKYVTEALNSGWEIAGSVFLEIRSHGQCPIFYQPMIKQTTEDNKEQHDQ